jgi:hypothetical protein
LKIEPGRLIVFRKRREKNEARLEPTAANFVMRGYMSRLLQFLGFLFLLLGVVMAILIAFTPGQMQVLGFTYEVAAILLAGGAATLGLGSILDEMSETTFTSHQPAVPHMPAAIEPLPSIKPASFSKPSEFQPAKVAPVVAAAAVVTKPEPVATPGVAETISALEQAKTDIAVALGLDQPVSEKPEPEVKEKEKPAFTMVPPAAEKPAAPPPPPAPTITLVPPAPPPAASETDEADDPDLYVVEEKVIRGRPARVLSDGTVEAETDEGWMRFENLEHLDEYLEAMAP